MRAETLAVHAGAEPDPATGAIAPPLHLSTTFRHGPAGERIGGFEYQRESNPTQARLEQALALIIKDSGQRRLATVDEVAAAVLAYALPACTVSGEHTVVMGESA